MFRAAHKLAILLGQQHVRRGDHRRHPGCGPALPGFLGPMDLAAWQNVACSPPAAPTSRRTSHRRASRQSPRKGAWQEAHSRKGNHQRQCANPKRKQCGAEFSRASSSTFAHLVWRGCRIWAAVATRRMTSVENETEQSNGCRPKSCNRAPANPSTAAVAAFVVVLVAGSCRQATTSMPVTAHHRCQCRCRYPSCCSH